MPPSERGDRAGMRRGNMPRVIEEVALCDLDLRFAPLRLHSPADLARLKASVEREGIRQPVLAATEVEPGKRVLVDGFKRVRVARELELACLAVILLRLDAPAALAAMLRSNAAHRGMTALEEGWIVRTMCREHGLTQASAGALLGHHQSWVCQRLRLAEQLDEALKDDLRLGLLPPAVARELGRLPRGQQMRAARVVREQGLSSRQTARLVQTLVATDDPRVRLEVLADPLRFVVSAPAEPAVKAKTDPRLSAGGNDLQRSLLVWEGAAWRLSRSLISHAPTGLRAEDRRVLASSIGQAVTSGRRTLERLEQLAAKGDGHDPR
jgi:ParB-like chromosome segregation protein Spo0J